jgi:Holliday junction resolvase-like predicted endonuclease
VTFQADAGTQGRAFEAVVENNLTLAGWRIIERHWREPYTQIEVDLVAVDPLGQVWWIECKGSWPSPSRRNGTTRTDTAKKLIANAALLSLVADAAPYMLVTSDMPIRDSAGWRWIELARREGWLKRYEVVSMFPARPREAT